jgi:hypothetical protein
MTEIYQKCQSGKYVRNGIPSFIPAIPFTPYIVIAYLVLPTINTYLTGSLYVSTLFYFRCHFGIISTNWIKGNETECQWMRFTCADHVPRLRYLQDPPLTHTITHISSSLSVYYRASFTLQVLRSALIFVAVAVGGNLFHFNAFLYDYVTVLVFYLISSSCAYILLGVFGICAAATLRLWMFVAVSTPKAKQLSETQMASGISPEFVKLMNFPFILILCMCIYILILSMYIYIYIRTYMLNYFLLIPSLIF